MLEVNIVNRIYHSSSSIHSITKATADARLLYAYPVLVGSYSSLRLRNLDKLLRGAKRLG